MEDIVQIESDELLTDFNHHFKVIAGPGAGKTFWLTRNIKNIARNSDLLTNSSKIACISYTNVAVNEIIEDIDICEDTVEVSTIHSFLYKNIVKPYIHLLKDDLGENLVNIKKMDGHHEHVPHYGHIINWIDEISELTSNEKLKLQYKIPINKERCFNNLKKIICKIDNNEKCIFTITNSGPFPNALKEHLYEYKKRYWSKGIIDHNDVLYLSYQIINQNLGILKFLSSRYRYIFLDEFQDTNPIQTKLIRLLGENGSIIGVIGDPSQSIYSFTGASRQDFIDFKLPDMVVYKIEGNRRSNKNIVDFLNIIRKKDPYNLIQTCKKGKSDDLDIELIILPDINDILDVYDNKRDEHGISDFCIMSWKTEFVNQLNQIENSKIWDELYDIDEKRYIFLKNLLSAKILIENCYYKAAIDSVYSLTRNNKIIKGEIIPDSIEQRKIAISVLSFISNYDYDNGNKVINFYLALNDSLFENFGLKLKSIRSGKFSDFSNNYLIKELYDNLNSLHELSKNRTIHKTKGAEFESVLIYFEKENDFNKSILTPDVNSVDDFTRTYYVAFSRAKRHLCLAIPSEDPEVINNASQIGISIINNRSKSQKTLFDFFETIYSGVDFVIAHRSE